MEEEKSILDELERDPSTGKYLFKLIDPIEFGKETITELRLEKPKAKHIRSLPTKPTTGDMLVIFEALACLTRSQVDELSMKDVTRLGEFIDAFS